MHNKGMSGAIGNVYSYHLFRAAQQKFGRKPKDLSAHESAAADAVARKTLFVENKILTSPEAQAVSVDPADVHDARKAMIARYDSYCAFLGDLRESGIDDAVLFLSIERQLKVDKTIAKAVAHVEEPSETEIADLYRRRQDEFIRPEQRAISHILITVNPQFPENSPAAALKRIEELHARLRREPQSFALLAALHSECPSALQSGNLGVFGADQLMKPLADAAFALRQGEIGTPVETEVGFHIARCDRIVPARSVPLKEARAKIAAAIGETKRQKAKRQWIKALCAPAAGRGPAAFASVNSKCEKISPAAQKRRQVCAP